MLFFGEVGMLCSHFCALSLLLAVSCVAADTRYLLYSVNAGIYPIYTWTVGYLTVVII